MLDYRKERNVWKENYRIWNQLSKYRKDIGRYRILAMTFIVPNVQFAISSWCLSSITLLVVPSALLIWPVIVFPLYRPIGTIRSIPTGLHRDWLPIDKSLLLHYRPVCILGPCREVVFHQDISSVSCRWWYLISTMSALNRSLGLRPTPTNNLYPTAELQVRIKTSCLMATGWMWMAALKENKVIEQLNSWGIHASLLFFLRSLSIFQMALDCPH